MLIKVFRACGGRVNEADPIVDDLLSTEELARERGVYELDESRSRHVYTIKQPMIGALPQPGDWLTFAYRDTELTGQVESCSVAFSHGVADTSISVRVLESCR